MVTYILTLAVVFLQLAANGSLTVAGTLVVGGAGLHIGKLDLDGGALYVDGAIHSLFYEERSTAPQGGFLRRLLG